MKITFGIELNAEIITRLIISLARHDYHDVIDIIEKNIATLEIEIK